MPERFKPLITALDAVGEDNLSFEKVKGMLLNDADRMSDTNFAEQSEHQNVDEADNQEALYTSNDNCNPGWIIDSGATQHMTFEKDRIQLH